MNNEFNENNNNENNVVNPNDVVDNNPQENNNTDASASESKQPDLSEEVYHYKWENGIPVNDTASASDGRKNKHSNKKLKIFAAVMSVLTVLSIASLIFVLSMNTSPFINGDTSSISESSQNNAVENTNSYVPFTAAISQGENALSLQAIAEKLDKSTVTVYCTQETTGWSGGSSIVFGSGFVISKDGYIVTNHHVIDGAKTIKAIFYDGTEYEATLVGSDALYDIAVLKIDGKDLTPVELGSSDELVVGDMVVAIGTPYSLDLAGTHTFGFISATDRKIKVSNGSSIEKTMTMLQTDATLNSGNSGGPLVNMKGQVIGINTMKLVSDFEGIGFAIPMSDAVDIINQLIESGKVTDPNGSVTASAYLGIEPTEVTKQDSDRYNVPMGVLVNSIDTKGSAYKAGLRQNDIITEFAGDKIESYNDLVDSLSNHQAGENITIKVYRDGKTVDLTFVLDTRPSSTNG